MYQIISEHDGPVCPTYTRQTARDAVASLRVLGSSGQVWPCPSTPQAISARGLEVLSCVEDTLISEAYRVTVIGSQVETRTRKTLRGLIRLRAQLDGQGGASAEAPSAAQAERLALAALASSAPLPEPFCLDAFLSPDTGLD
jgi:hypothetical protein